MNVPEKFGAIQLALEVLRRANIENGVSMAVNKDTGELIFFDTAIYVSTGKMTGFTIHPEELVK